MNERMKNECMEIYVALTVHDRSGSEQLNEAIIVVPLLWAGQQLMCTRFIIQSFIQNVRNRKCINNLLIINSHYINCVHFSVVVMVEGKPKEYCQLSTFHASCELGQVIIMKSALFGRMRTGVCNVRELSVGCSGEIVYYKSGPTLGQCHLCRMNAELAVLFILEEFQIHILYTIYSESPHYTLNNIGSSKRIIQYYYHATPGEPCTITMQPQENPARVLLGLHGKSTEGFLLKNLYCLECIITKCYHTAGAR